jgi:hypothetical protein
MLLSKCEAGHAWFEMPASVWQAVSLLSQFQAAVAGFVSAVIEGLVSFSFS